LPPEEATFNFDGFWVDSVSLENAPRAERLEGEEKPKKVDCTFRPSGQLVVNPEARRAELALNVGVAPDPKWQPYVISVRVVGRFSQAAGPIEQFAQFLRMGAPAILFPYIREIIDRLTADGKYGRVRLNPVNIQAMLAWGVEEVISNEPSLLSGQSPSASPDSKPQP
jgi:preprotein translocase subunit SecB